MKAPRDLARARSRARTTARWAPARPARAAAAVTRALSDLNVWEDSIQRSRMRREAMERQLNFGPVTGKRVAVPMAMLAAGLLVRDAAVSAGDGFDIPAPDAAAAKSTATKSVAAVKPATVAGRKAVVHKPAAAK